MLLEVASLTNIARRRDMAKELSHFYLNIVLLNGGEVVKDQVKEKAGTGVFGKVLVKNACL